MAAHTPGPWELHELPLDADAPHVTGELEPSFRIEGESTLFLTVCPCSDGYISGQNEANARLIAAAPDLLEALNGGRGAKPNALDSNLDFFADLIEGKVQGRAEPGPISLSIAAKVMRAYAVIIREAIVKATGEGGRP